MSNKKFKPQKNDCYKKLLTEPSLAYKMAIVFLKIMPIFLFIFFVTTQNVFADVLNIQPVNDSVTNIGTMLQNFASYLAFLMFVVAGIAIMIGQQGRQWGKPTMLWTAVGYLIVCFAPDLVKVVQQAGGH